MWAQWKVCSETGAGFSANIGRRAALVSPSVPQLSRTALPHLCCTFAALMLHLCRTYAALMLHLCHLLCCSWTSQMWHWSSIQPAFCTKTHPSPAILKYCLQNLHKDEKMSLRRFAEFLSKSSQQWQVGESSHWTNQIWHKYFQNTNHFRFLWVLCLIDCFNIFPRRRPFSNVAGFCWLVQLYLRVVTRKWIQRESWFCRRKTKN